MGPKNSPALGDPRSSHETTWLISTSLPPGIQGSRITQEMSSVTFHYYISHWESWLSVIYSWQNKSNKHFIHNSLRQWPRLQFVLFSHLAPHNSKCKSGQEKLYSSSDAMEKYFCVISTIMCNLKTEWHYFQTEYNQVWSTACWSQIEVSYREINKVYQTVDSLWLISFLSGSFTLWFLKHVM